MHNNFKYRGARAMTVLHAQHMRSCLAAWHKAKTKGVTLPQTSDKDFDSMEHIIHHVLRAARGYMIWICENLNLPNPEIDEVPELDVIEEQADRYLKHLLEQWALPMVDVEEDRFDKLYMSNWGIEYCIDSMMEHAVMHPIRHEFQLRELMGG